MSGTHEHAVDTRLRRTATASELCVVVGCHTFACAIPIRHISHLLLNEDVSEVSRSRGLVVSAGGEFYATSNLGSQLELPASTGDWVLLHMPTKRNPMPIALRTGRCLVVRDVSIRAPLVPSFFKQRGEAIAGAFITGANKGFPEGIVCGLVLNVGGLWTERELESLGKAIFDWTRGPDG